MQPSHWCHFQSVVLTGQQDGAAEEEMKTGADSQSSCMEIEGTAYASHCYCSDLSSSVEIPFCFPCFQEQNRGAESSSGNPDFSPEQGSSCGFSVTSDGFLTTASIREKSEHSVFCSSHWVLEPCMFRALNALSADQQNVRVRVPPGLWWVLVRDDALS